MILKKVQTFAQIVGFVTIGLLALYGALTLLSRGDLMSWAAGGRAGAAQSASATVPTVMNYQGILKDAEGDPLDGTYTMTFRIYDSVTAPLTDTLWSEQHINVTVREGRFNVLLGYSEPLSAELFSQPECYLGVAVDPYDEMYPRQRFASVPYAFHANYATGLSAADGDPLDAVTVDDEGEVGVGTTSPDAKLHVSAEGDWEWSEWGNNPVEVWDGNEALYLGADEDNDVSYIQAVGDFVAHSLLLNARGGKVGIGTASPGAKLHVSAEGEWSWSEGITNPVEIWDGSETLYMGADNNNNVSYIQAVGDGTLHSLALNAKGGKVGIGTTVPTYTLDVVGDRIRLRDSTAEGAKGIALRTDGGAVDVSAYNADLYLGSTTGNIRWDGSHLASMSVSGEYHVDAPAGDWAVADMGSTDNRICFLVGVAFNDLDSGDEWGICGVDAEDGRWKLKAWEADDDNDAWCEARCLSW